MRSVVGVAALGSALAFAACRDGTSPSANATDEVIVHLDSSTVTGLRSALGDAAVRLAPSLRDAIARAQLNAQLTDLSEQVNTGRKNAALRTIGLARKTIERLNTLGDRAGASADIEQIAWSLDQVELALKSPAPVPASASK